MTVCRMPFSLDTEYRVGVSACAIGGIRLANNRAMTRSKVKEPTKMATRLFFITVFIIRVFPRLFAILFGPVIEDVALPGVGNHPSNAWLHGYCRLMVTNSLPDPPILRIA